MSFSTLGLDSSLAGKPRAPRLCRADAGAARSDSRGARGRRPAGLVADRQRQDRRLRAAGPAAPAHAGDAPPASGPRMLVLTPTRELAHAGAEGDARLLQRPAARTALPGRRHAVRRAARAGEEAARHRHRHARPAEDHMDRGSVDLERVELLVLDEADRMLDMGFQEEIDSIIAQRAEGAPDAALLGHARRRGRQPRRARHAQPEARRDRAPRGRPSPTSRSTRLIADNDAHKDRMLDRLLRETEVEQALVFTAMKRTAAELTAVAGRARASPPARCTATCTRTSAPAR